MDKLTKWQQVPKKYWGKVLPHDNVFTELEEEMLRAKGYEPINICFVERGPEAVELTLEAARLGLCDLSRDQLRAIELQAKLYRVDKGLEETTENVVLSVDLEKQLKDISKLNPLQDAWDSTLPKVEK